MEENEKPLLRNRSYLLLLQGNLFSGFGDVLFSIAAGIWVYKQTGSTMMMSVMSSISMAVSVLITPFLGPIVDRRSKKRMMVLMDFIRGVTLVLAGFEQSRQTANNAFGILNTGRDADYGKTLLVVTIELESAENV